MRKILVLLLVPVILLSGCTAEKGVSTPLPPPSPAAVITEKPSPAPTPSHAMGLSELLAAAEGQDFDIRAYNVEAEDLAQCADFAKYTGFTTLSAPLENVTKYSHRYANGYCYESFHQAPPNAGQDEIIDWVLITDAGAGDGFFQEIQVPGNEGAGSISGELDIKDIDLDGHDDNDSRPCRAGACSRRVSHVSVVVTQR